MQDGFFLRKKPFQGITFPLHQLENRYSMASGRLHGGTANTCAPSIHIHATASCCCNNFLK
jgi:hypothetical protein